MTQTSKSVKTPETGSLLHDVQMQLKVEKNQWNDHNKFKYRTLGDIISAIKPLIAGRGVLNFTDDIVMLGDRHYVKSTCTLTDMDGAQFSATGYARENSRKGMDDAQMTGACSTYARKYAAQGLFAIDEGQDDPDHLSSHQPPVKQAVPQKPELNPQHPNWKLAHQAVSEGTYTIEDVQHKYYVTEQNIELLTKPYNG